MQVSMKQLLSYVCRFAVWCLAPLTVIPIILMSSTWSQIGHMQASQLDNRHIRGKAEARNEAGTVSPAGRLDRGNDPSSGPHQSIRAAAAAKSNLYLPLIRKDLPPPPRGYLTTPQELADIRQKANQGVEPYKSAVEEVISYANRPWSYQLSVYETCPGSEEPAWNSDREGTPILYAKALAYHLTGETRYAEEAKSILQSIMTNVKQIDLEEQQCQLNFAWGTPELVAAADLIESYWYYLTCTGPLSTSYSDTRVVTGNCKALFQNWLAKNPYYVVSFAAIDSNSNWGAAATNTTAHIADYLSDRSDVELAHRNPRQVNDGQSIRLTPTDAYAYANQLMLDRMNGYGVEYTGNSCDLLSGPQQSSLWPPVKSQITENGIVSQDARREQYCNIPQYNGVYQNYPQIHLGHNIQQCELMLRRGDTSCYDNVDTTDIPNYTYTGPDGEPKVTHLYPGRGSIERAIKAVIVDSGTEWRHDSALEVAYRYYYTNHRLPGFEQWRAQLDRRPSGCSQDVCFGTLTHGFADGETPALPPTAPPIGAR